MSENEGCYGIRKLVMVCSSDDLRSLQGSVLVVSGHGVDVDVAVVDLWLECYEKGLTGWSLRLEMVVLVTVKAMVVLLQLALK
ncbi:hypothetical protein C5167_035141 [Papaver somniferum]|uniref:Uncharacterized protein n=1 Tax=Papaver somniferum TaxID=3469 RepID=A0A4Y7KGJ3_PAPSO|nr:hypothetical protein C5167_035141 [Papaver somniferum]